MTPGISLLETFRTDGSTRHESLWWFHTGNRALRRGDWKISAKSEPDNHSGPWELYDLKTDRAEMHDLAAKHPEQVRALAAQWEKTAAGFRRDLNKERSGK